MVGYEMLAQAQRDLTAEQVCVVCGGCVWCVCVVCGGCGVCVVCGDCVVCVCGLVCGGCVV